MYNSSNQISVFFRVCPIYFFPGFSCAHTVRKHMKWWCVQSFFQVCFLHVSVCDFVSVHVFIFSCDCLSPRLFPACCAARVWKIQQTMELNFCTNKWKRTKEKFTTLQSHRRSLRSGHVSSGLCQGNQRQESQKFCNFSRYLNWLIQFHCGFRFCMCFVEFQMFKGSIFWQLRANLLDSGFANMIY